MRTALALAALGLLAPTAGALAQDAAPSVPEGVRVLHDITDAVKLDDGSTATWRFLTTYDPASGVTVQTVTDEAGRVVRRETGPGGLDVPAPQEIARAEALIRADPELAAIIAAAPNPIVTGGFTLRREAGHPCGPEGRCLQFDVINVNEAARHVERLRYVVVDARTWEILDRDFDPAAEGNSANPHEARSYDTH